MAVVEFVAYHKGSEDTAAVNDYISDGHGDEVLSRTNRYITGEHACGNRCIGVNCPSDPTLATEHMDRLRALYEHNHAGRGLKGATDASQGASHYQLIVSWEPDEYVPVAERYEMMQDLIRRTRLNDYANLLAAHENKSHGHIHDSLSAYSLDGTHKLAMNNALLYDLRREMDRICVEHGYSIVYSPELMGNKEYAAWFEYVLDQELVTIHPPRSKAIKNKSEAEKYQAAKAEEHLAKKALIEDLLKPRRVTAKNRGTDFYGLPYVYLPDKPDAQLYVYALDDEGKRKSPLQLDLSLQIAWAHGCLTKLESMGNYAGKKRMQKRLTWARDNALEAIDLITSLDIGTYHELEAHFKAVGGEIRKCRQEISRQEKVIATARETGNTAKLRRAEERKARAEERKASRSNEYRQLKRAAAVLDNMENGEHWDEFRQELLSKSIRKVKATDAAERMIRRNYQDIGQLFGISQEEIDAIVDKALALPDDAIVETWVVMRGELQLTFARRANGMTALYNSIRDDCANRNEVRREYRRLTHDFPVAGPITAMLYLALVIPLGVAEARQELELERRIAAARQLAEDIRWHNDNAQDSFDAAKSRFAEKLALGNEEEIYWAWMEFMDACDSITLASDALMLREAEYNASGYTTSVRSIHRQIREMEALRDAILSEPEPDWYGTYLVSDRIEPSVGPRSLQDMIDEAEDIRNAQPYEHEKEGLSR